MSEPTATVHRASRARLLLLCGLPVLLAGLVYLNALHNPFVWDDFHTIVTNPALQAGDLASIVARDATRPLVSLSYALDIAIWGPGTFGLHLTSVLLHMLNVLLLFLVGKRIVQDGQPHGSPGDAGTVSADAAAGAAATMFAIHPMMTEAVGYISARADVLCTTFVLLAFLATRAWIGGGGRRALVSGVLLWLLALATKEVALVFPVLLLCYGSFVPLEENRLDGERLARISSALVVATLLAAAVRFGVLVLIENPGGSRIHWPLVLVEIDAVREYLLLMVQPAAQSVLHTATAINSLFSVRAFVAVGFLAALILFAYRTRRANGAIGFGVLWFLLMLAPPAALVVRDLGHPIAEHRAYLASCGLFLAVATAYGFVVSRSRGSLRSVRLLRPLALGIGVLALSGTTIVRNAVWASPELLWLDAVEKAPDIWLPRLLLGEALHASGAHARAVAAFRRVIQLRPDYGDTYLKLGLCLTELQRVDEAKAIFTELTRVDPDSPAGATGLGTLALMTGDDQEARRRFVQALTLDPRSVGARQSLALLSERASRPADALRYCEEIERLAPSTPDNAECIRRNRERLGGPAAIAR